MEISAATRTLAQQMLAGQIILSNNNNDSTRIKDIGPIVCEITFRLDIPELAGLTEL